VSGFEEVFYQIEEASVRAGGELSVEFGAVVSLDRHAGEFDAAAAKVLEEPRDGCAGVGLGELICVGEEKKARTHVTDCVLKLG